MKRTPEQVGRSDRRRAMPWNGALWLLLLASGLYGYTWMHTHRESMEVNRTLTDKYADRMRRLGVERINVGVTAAVKHWFPGNCGAANAQVIESSKSVEAYVPTNIPNFVYFKATLNHEAVGPSVVANYQGTVFRPDAPQPSDVDAAKAVSAELDFILTSLEQHAPLCP